MVILIMITRDNEGQCYDTNEMSITNNAMIINFDLEFSPKTVTAHQFVMGNIAKQINKVVRMLLS